MRTSQEGIDLIKSFEGCRLIAYQDSAEVWTIGYGHTACVYHGMMISQEQADDYLALDLAEYESYVEAYVTVPLSQNQFDALVSFTYNLGPGTLKHSELLSFLNAGQDDQAAEEFVQYCYADGRQEPGLLRRRQAERALFLGIREPASRFSKFMKWLRN